MVIALAWKQFKSHWAAGELRVLLMALVLAVASTTAVSFFTDRVNASLNQQGSLLLGGDMVVSANRAISLNYIQQAKTMGLQTAQTMEFPSMVLFGDLSQLAEIKVLSQEFPLRGDFLLAHQDSRLLVKSPPQKGTVWIEPKLANLLGVKVGDYIQVGELSLSVAALITREASRGGDMFSFAPRVMMSQADIAASGLIQYGSRVKYQLVLAGDAGKLKKYELWAKTQLQNGERIEDVSSARPEVRSALEKSQQFLGLSAMVSVVLSIVAMLLASIPYMHSSLHTFALMRCFGASTRLISQILLIETLYIAIVGAVLGSGIGFFAQAGLVYLASSLLVTDMPAFSFQLLTWHPFLLGFVMSVATMLAVMWPHLARLSHASAMRILRSDIAHSNVGIWVRLMPLVMIFMLMVYAVSNNVKLASAAILGFVALLVVVSALSCGALILLKRLPDGQSSIWKLGVAGLKRRPMLAVAQCMGLSLGLMALILLAFIRSDLMQNWRDSLPENAPNRFVINIQPDQLNDIKAFLKQAGVDATMYPMIRGRLIEVNGQAFESKQFEDERARRLAEREFNLSMASSMQSDNQLLSGRWWESYEDSRPYISLEQGLADTLGLKLGDQLTYNIAGTHITLQVTSLRKVEWDSMRANFFALTPPKTLTQFNASYMTSLYLPAKHESLINTLVKQNPNLTVIDVEAIMQQVRGIMNKMTGAIQYVFIFSVLAGLAVLYAALVATREERVREATLLRVLGASRKQVTLASLAEFFCIGLVASIVATVAAEVLAYVLSVQVLNIRYELNLMHAMIAILSATIFVPAAAWLVTRQFLNHAPRQLLQSC